MILDKNSTDTFDTWYNSVHDTGGVVLVNKGKNWTSFDFVAKIRNMMQVRKVGHAGTLDPLATGLLILCLGKYTKKISEFQDLNKTYRAKIKVGATTKTSDSEMEEENIKDYSGLNEGEIRKVCSSFVGEISQIPPMFSAKKVKGKRLYKLARKGIDIELKPSLVKVYSIDILDIDLPFIDIDVTCSKGTYIRSLARDIGERLGTGAYLAELERTDIGGYSLSEALTINEINDLIVKYKSSN